MGLIESISRRVHRKRLEWYGLRYLRLIIVFSLLFFIVVIVGIIYFFRGSEVGVYVRDGIDGGAYFLGLRVDEIVVSGGDNILASDLSDVLFGVEGSVLHGVDIYGLRKSFGELGWVKDVEIVRDFPNVLRIDIVERVPVALWQFGGEHYLIDIDGFVIAVVGGGGEFSDLFLVVGEGANLRLGVLVDLLSVSDVLSGMVVSASWVGGRRWDIYLVGDVRVQLPQDGVDVAWGRVEDLVVEGGILERSVEVIDMRVADRIIVRLRE